MVDVSKVGGRPSFTGKSVKTVLEMKLIGGIGTCMMVQRIA